MCTAKEKWNRAFALMQDITTQNIWSFMTDITKGMEYLSERHVVHCDLAARNCVWVHFFMFWRDTFLVGPLWFLVIPLEIEHYSFQHQVGHKLDSEGIWFWISKTHWELIPFQTGGHDCACAIPMDECGSPLTFCVQFQKWCDGSTFSLPSKFLAQKHIFPCFVIIGWLQHFPVVLWCGSMGNLPVWGIAIQEHKRYRAAQATSFGTQQTGKATAGPWICVSIVFLANHFTDHWFPQKPH